MNQLLDSEQLFPTVVLAWGLAEIALAATHRARVHGGPTRDEGSFVFLFLAVAGGVTFASYSPFLPGPRLPGAAIQWTAVWGLLLVGIGMRWFSVVTLGRDFTVNVSTERTHRLVRTGLYRWMRHPSYTGLCLISLAAGIAYGTWLGLLVSLISVTTPLLYRIRVEEDVLTGLFGEEYREYCRHTKRLIPGIF
ncbi:MAG: methyltransferase family protein [Dehalococcoidia bacterium]